MNAGERQREDINDLKGGGGRLANCVEDNPGMVPRIKSNQGPNGGQSALIDCTMIREMGERGNVIGCLMAASR